MDHFEGPEKKLEIILSEPAPRLRGNDDGRWNRVVRAGGAEILQSLHTPSVDAYLLSESSLFVWDNRLVMITCGQTTPALALPEILKFVDPALISGLFYERKNLNFPDQQPTDFDQDRRYLSGFFPKGQSFLFGSPDRDHVHMFYYARQRQAGPQAAVLRVLMNDIDPEVGALFSPEADPDRLHARTLGKLSFFDESVMLDNYFFQPQGYSLNGVSGAHYLTLHVTPESPASYSSLETSLLDETDCGTIIDEIAGLFEPKRFCLFLKSPCDDHCRRMHHTLPDSTGGFERLEVVQRQLDPGCRVTFANFQRSSGGFT